MKRVAKRVFNRMVESKMVQQDPFTYFGSVATTGLWTYLAPAIGTGYGQRIGRAYTPTKLTFQFLLHGGQSNLALDDSHNVVRLSVVRLDSGIVPASVAYGIGTPLDINKGTCKGVRQVLYDKHFTLDSPGRDSTGYMAIQRWIKKSFRLGKKINVADDGTTHSSVYNIWMVSDSAVAPSPGVTGGYIRWYFKDA